MSSSRTCPTCCTALDSLPEDALRLCGACQRPNPKGFYYCGFCASPMAADAPQTASSDPSAAPDREQRVHGDSPPRPSGVRKRIVRSERSSRAADIESDESDESDAPCKISPMRTVTARHFGAIASPITAVLCSFRNEK